MFYVGDAAHYVKLIINQISSIMVDRISECRLWISVRNNGFSRDLHDTSKKVIASRYKSELTNFCKES